MGENLFQQPKEVLAERSVPEGLQRPVETGDVHDQDLALPDRDAGTRGNLKVTEDMSEPGVILKPELTDYGWT